MGDRSNYKYTYMCIYNLWVTGIIIHIRIIHVYVIYEL